MHPATKQFIEVLTLDVNKWEDAAKRIEDDLLPHLHASEVQRWKETAKGYRKYAAEYKVLVEEAKKNDRE